MEKKWKLLYCHSRGCIQGKTIKRKMGWKLLCIGELHTQTGLGGPLAGICSPSNMIFSFKPSLPCLIQRMPPDTEQEISSDPQTRSLQKFSSPPHGKSPEQVATTVRRGIRQA